MWSVKEVKRHSSRICWKAAIPATHATGAKRSRRSKRSQSADAAAWKPETSSPESRYIKPTGWRKWAFRLAAVIVPVVLFLLLLELGLRLFGCGHPAPFFVPIEGQDAHTTNQKFGWRFFPPVISRTPVVCRLPAEKDSNTYRIFVLGGSAAQGTPAPAFSFGRILQIMLEEQYRGAKFEVVNTAMTAINSHVVLTIARDCADYDPDLFIVYMGNNEVVGPYGPGTVFQGYSPSRFMIRAGIAAKATRIGQLIESLAGLLGKPNEGLTDWKGMEFFLNNRVTADDPRLARVYSHFRENLSDVCEAARGAGAKTIVCTVVSNLKDNAPFASMHRWDLSRADQAGWEEIYNAGTDLEERGLYGQAVEKYLAAADDDDRFAALHFRLGRCFVALQERDRAHDHYIRARDLDALRFRTDTQLNEAVREVAEAKESRGVYLVDAVRVFEQSDKTRYGIPGQELLFEHVHLNFAGNYVLAEAVFQKLAGLLPQWVRDHASKRSALPSQDRCARRLALTAWDRYRRAGMIFDVLRRPPFVNQLDYERRRALSQEHLEELKRQATSKEAIQEARRTYLWAIALKPDDLLIRGNLAKMLLDLGDAHGAAEQLDYLVWRVPGIADWHADLGVSLVAQGRTTAGMEQVGRALQIMPDYAQAHGNLAIVLAQQNKLGEAAQYFRRALRINPDYQRAHYGLAGVLVRQGELNEAVAHYSESLRLRPHHPEAHYDLATTLAQQGKTDEAVTHFAEALRLKPDYAQAHYNLAVARSRQGETGQAVVHYSEVLRLMPDSLDVLGNLAWILATDDSAEVRDPARAIQLAERACALTGHKQPAMLDTLAAAYASAGRFSQAVETAKKAAALAEASGRSELAGDIRARLRLYREGRPYRQPPQPPHPVRP